MRAFLTSFRLPLAALAATFALTTPAVEAPPAKGAPPAKSAPAATPAPAPATPSATMEREAWRGTRWGMTPAEVVAALPGEAKLLDPPQTLADGTVLAAGIDGYAWDGLATQVRFVFERGALSLVSLKTNAEAGTYEKMRTSLVGKWGAPLETTSDDNLIDMRQTRWERGASRADLKYIPGTLVLLLYPAPPSTRTASPTATN